MVGIDAWFVIKFTDNPDPVYCRQCSAQADVWPQPQEHDVETTICSVVDGAHCCMQCITLH
jgi:hypothetical protein